MTYSQPSAPVLSFDTLHNRLRLTGTLTTRTGMRIGVGRDTDVAGHDLPVIRNAAGQPFIPGSSFKGVLRSQVEALLRGLSSDSTIQREKLACMVLIPHERCIPDSRLKAWREANKSSDELSDLIIQKSCMTCQTFGSTWLASHIALSDMPVNSTYWFGQFEIRTGVALERDTATARQGMLYNFETVPPGTPFHFTLEADNLTDWQKGLLWLALQPFVRGEGRIGGATSRGLGQMELTNAQWYLWESDGTPTSVIQLLSEGLTPLDNETDKPKAWRKALRYKLEEVCNAQDAR